MKNLKKVGDQIEHTGAQKIGTPELYIKDKGVINLN